MAISIEIGEHILKETSLLKMAVSGSVIRAGALV